MPLYNLCDKLSFANLCVHTYLAQNHLPHFRGSPHNYATCPLCENSAHLTLVLHYSGGCYNPLLV